MSSLPRVLSYFQIARNVTRAPLNIYRIVLTDSNRVEIQLLQRTPTVWVKLTNNNDNGPLYEYILKNVYKWIGPP